MDFLIVSIDLNDFIIKVRPNSKKRDKKYHLYCDTCGKSRGYNSKYIKNCDCNSCASVKKMANVSKEEKSKRGKYAVKHVKNHVFTQDRKDKISKANTGKTRSLEHKVKNSAQRQGIAISEWKDFLYNTDDPKRSKYKSEKYCLKVYEKYDFTCDTCSKRGGKLHGHHLDNWSQFKDKRYDLDNIVCLCKECHKEFHHRYGTRNNIKEQYIEFKNSCKLSKIVNSITVQEEFKKGENDEQK